MPEEKLIKSILEGDENACKVFYMRYKDIVFNTALRMLRLQEEAEDITQEVFVHVFLNASNFRGQSQVTTWLYRITVNKCLDRIRSQKTQKRDGNIVSFYSGDDEYEISLPDHWHPGRILEEKEKGELLLDAIARLPDQQRAAFVLHKVEDRPYQEIADILETTLPAVESLIFRARQNLRKMLSAYFGRTARKSTE